MEQLAAISRMPWEPGSWLFKIEKGMSGLGHYIYQKYIPYTIILNLPLFVNIILLSHLFTIAVVTS